MAIYILVCVVAFFCFFTISLFVQTKHLTDRLDAKLKTFNKSITFNHLIYILILVVCFIFIFISFYAPDFYTDDVHNILFKDSIKISSEDSLEILKDEYAIKGQIGDKFGGLMNPYIAIAGVIVTGLAFWIQYKANQDVRKQFTLQQFDSKFNEMIRLHKENVNEMEIEGYVFSDEVEDLVLRTPKENDNSTRDEVTYVNVSSNRKGKSSKKEFKITQGRKVFVTIKTEFECILALLRENSLILDKTNFEMCYQIFFFGVDYFENKYNSIVTEDESLENIYVESFINDLKKARAQHEDFFPRNSVKNRKKYKGVKLYFNYKPFSGHSSRLGHYYRHMFLIVTSIVTPQTIVLNELQKKQYLKILRAQLSNHEQSMLFYNWLGGYGKEWQSKENDGNRFFTKYNMIHNLWYSELFKNKHITDNIEFLKSEFDKDYPNRNITSNSKKKEMFEIDES